ncbi:Glycosyltransferase, GT2 family [Flavobacterium segetis]|uniref:Glycosyltransferase, GT2 family n=1 Tax=Flavobacterium segetis TaxID=271157 RepID=A0A1M5E9B9_9FLAO|nr:glycosyltransferase family 2 protein [Flavobacterium segetis]SHF75780.1 Glycosyltransferase, GT2 family [Flavobacterium segetis]
MQLSVIILNYNVRYFLELCIISVQNALVEINSEIIVIDNNSHDDSCEMMITRFPNVKLIQNNDNLGFSKGNNIAVDKAKGEYICVLNPDTVVAEDTFIKILAFAQRQKKLGIIGCKLIDGAGNFLPESKRGVPTPWVAFTKISGLYKFFPKSKLFDQYYAGHLDENETGKVDILVGAFMFMKRDLYREVGGFDEDCFMYSDDIDLSYVVSQKGNYNYYFHQTTVIHFKGESTVKDRIYMKRFAESMNFFYNKHIKSKGLGSIYFTVFMKIGIVFFFLTRKLQHKIQEVLVPNAYYLYSTSEILLNKLCVLLQKKVTLHNLKNQKELISCLNRNDNKVEMILDNESISFKDYISFLELAKNKGFTFKIKPKNANFLIGSNNSNERGEVIKIEEKNTFNVNYN